MGEQISGRRAAYPTMVWRRSSSISRREAATGTVRTFSRLAPRPPTTVMGGVSDTTGPQVLGPVD